jgi:hypothetical protein
MKSSYLKRLELAILTEAPFGVGSFTPGNILLVGEQASNPASAPEQQPFCSDQGCSGWLNQRLAAEKIPEEKLFWVNALNNDGSMVDLQRLVEQLKPSAVIALGTVAKRTCERQCVAKIAVYHPQYWKRFRSKERYPLLDILQFLLLNTL